MKLVMIRHPVTFANVQGVIQHEVEGDIAPKGYEQIERLVSRLQLEHFDYCYSSDANRCRILAEAISKSHELSPQYSSLFREINNGVWNGSKKADIERLSLRVSTLNQKIEPILRSSNPETANDKEIFLARTIESKEKYALSFFDCIHLALCHKRDYILLTRDKELFWRGSKYTVIRKPEDLLY